MTVLFISNSHHLNMYGDSHKLETLIKAITKRLEELETIGISNQYKPQQWYNIQSGRRQHPNNDNVRTCWLCGEEGHVHCHFLLTTISQPEWWAAGQGNNWHSLIFSCRYAALRLMLTVYSVIVGLLVKHQSISGWLRYTYISGTPQPGKTFALYGYY